MLKAKNLKKTFGDKVAVDDISLEIRKGEVLGLLGPNGAGKSTTIKMLTGQYPPDSGEFTFDSKTSESFPDRLNENIGIMPQEIVLWDFLTLRENIVHTGILQNLSPSEAKTRAEELIKSLSLDKEEDTLAKNLSGGYKRRLHLAISIVHNPEMIFLDEPTPGIDAQSRRLLMNYIKDLRDNGDHAIVLTDHYLDEAEKLSDYVIIIDEGKVIAEGTVPELKKAHGKDSIIQVDVVSETDEAIVKNLISKMQKLNSSQVQLKKHTITQPITDPVKSINEVTKLLQELEIETLNIAVKEPTLEEVFLILTGKEVENDK